MAMQSSEFRRLLFAGAALALAMTAGGLASAAETGAAASSANVGEIVVTARKRDESVQDVPVAVTALNQVALSERGVTNFASLMQFVPGFRWNTQNASSAARLFNTFVMRGAYGGTDHPDRQNVTLFIDGAPIGGGGSIPGLGDTSRVEVVKGPQSAYFGRSSFGGAVNFVTQEPASSIHASADASIGTYGKTELRGSIEGPLVNDVLAARLTVLRSDTGSQYDNAGYGGKLGGQKTTAFTGSVLFRPVESVKIRGYYANWRDDDDPNATYSLFAPYFNCAANPAAPNTRNWVCGEIKSGPVSTVAQNLNVPPTLLPLITSINITQGPGFITEPGFKRHADFGYVSGEIALPSDMILSLIASKSTNKFASFIDAGQRFDTSGRYAYSMTPWTIKTESAEARLTTDGARRLRLMVGGNYFYQRSEVSTGTVKVTPPGTPPVTVPGFVHQYGLSHAYGLFGSLSYDLTEKVTVSAEGRYQSDRIGYEILTTGAKGEGTTKSFTPRVILQYQPTEDLNLYASYAVGTRPAQFNSTYIGFSPAIRAAVDAQVQVDPVVPEERIKMGEVGVKGRFLENRLRLALAGYYGKWSNKQIQQQITYSINGGQTFAQALLLFPLGQVDVYGFELEGSFRATDRLTFDGTLGYAETNIERTFCTDCRSITGNPTPVNTRLPRYPAVTGSLSGTYEQPISGEWRGYGRLDYVFTGKIFATEDNLTWVKSNHTFNLRIGARNDSYTAELWVTNLFNDKTPLSIARMTDTYNNDNGVALTPAFKRTVGVRLAAKY